MNKNFFPILILFLLWGCQAENNSTQSKESQTARHLTTMESPAEGESGEPNLFVDSEGTAYLTWISYLNGSTDALLFSRLEEGWSEPRQVAAGSDWFVNWADFPSLSAYPGGEDRLVAHWLAKSTSGTYDYDVHIAQSMDGGDSWSDPFIPHTDGKPAEHGFVTLLPLSSQRMMAVWLDGRYTKDTIDGERGAMTLRSATFDPQNRLYDEAELDHRICDCCQTDAALTNAGPLVVYRDRSQEEIRDIFYTRRVEGQWTDPKPVFADNWQIAGCPVNGPAVDARGNNVAVAWFSNAAEAGPQVKVAFSRDAGASFETPVRVDDGDPAGRVDIVLLEPELALVSWLENREKGAEIRAVKVSPTGVQGEPLMLVKTSESRRSGFPILAKAGKQILLAWTQVDENGSTTVKVGKMDGGY